MKKWIVAASLLSFVHTSYACTAVNLSAKDGTVIAGRTMEWAFDMKWQLNRIPKGTSIKLSAPAAAKLPTVSLRPSMRWLASPLPSSLVHPHCWRVKIVPA